MIPKNIMTCWLSFKKDWPFLVNRCIESQKLPGYTHKVITLENCYRQSNYVNECLEKAEKMFQAGEKEYVRWLTKASDWLRCWHICEEGGVYLDADMEVLPGKNFDDLLNCRFFTENEVYGMTANAGFGSEPGHPFLKEYLRRVEDNFRGSGEMVFDPGIRAFADLMWITDKEANGIVFLDTSVFFPYKHGPETIEITPETRVFHHYAGTWCGDNVKRKIGTDYENKTLDQIINKK